MHSIGFQSRPDLPGEQNTTTGSPSCQPRKKNKKKKQLLQGHWCWMARLHCGGFKLLANHSQSVKGHVLVYLNQSCSSVALWQRQRNSFWSSKLVFLKLFFFYLSMAEQFLYTVRDVDNLSRRTRNDQQERVQFLKKKKLIILELFLTAHKLGNQAAK